MARIVLGSYMVRYPMGGMMSYVLQYLLGFQRLGHDVYFVEKAGYPNSCFDPSRRVMSDDCTYGTRAVDRLLARFGLHERWCFVDARDNYHGLSRAKVEDVFKTAELFVDMGTHGAWAEEATGGLRVLIDGEPGFTQIKMEKRRRTGERLPPYDLYYTVGSNVAAGQSTAPSGDRAWRHLWHPVVVDLASGPPGHTALPFTTVMNWQSHNRIEFNGTVYGQKDVEFEHFIDLPRRTAGRLELAVSGHIPEQRLLDAGWTLRSAHEVTTTFDSFNRYIEASCGEFTVCKHVFVAANTGWFSDRSAAYLARGRPVVIEETGFSSHLPSGEGLLAVRNVSEAADAIDRVLCDYHRHARRAREIALEHLDASKVLGRFLQQLNIS
jgi:hypothetical protein